MKNMLGHITAILLMLSSCTNRDTTVDKSTLKDIDYRLFQNTPAWELAKAVESADTDKIKDEVHKNKDLLNFRDSLFDQPILKLAVMHTNYKSVEALVKLGADPNMQDKFDSYSPLMEAVRIGGGAPIHPYADPRFLKLLLSHGGDPNAEQQGKRRKGNFTRYTPLLIACQEGNFDYVKILVNAGANVNYDNEYGMNPLGLAIINGQNPDIVLYLIEKGADFKRPIFPAVQGGKASYIAEGLREWRFDLGSDKYKKKMQLVEFLKAHGIDYRKTEIPKEFLDEYPKDYLDKY
jgi:hypothetical protein